MLAKESKIKWDAFLSGDENAYCWMYNTYIQQLYHYGLRFTKDKELVKDCIQELFTTIYKNRQQLSSPDNVKVYLFVCLKHNLLRAISRENVFEAPEEETFFFLPEATAEEEFIEKERLTLQEKKIEKILSLLTPRQQEIIYYRYIQELSFHEICELMNMNSQSAQNLIQRSIRKIRDTFSIILPLMLTRFFFFLQQWFSF